MGCNIEQNIMLEHKLCLLEYRSGFNMEKFKKLDPNERLFYAEKTLGEPIGIGSSRVVWPISNRFILKVALTDLYDDLKTNASFQFEDPEEEEEFKHLKSNYDRHSYSKAKDKTLIKGLAQNREEVEIYTNPITKPIVAKMHNFADDYSWVISEPIREFKSKREFEDVLGLLTMELEQILHSDAKTLDEFVKKQFELSKKIIKKQQKIIDELEPEVDEYYIQKAQDKINNALRYTDKWEVISQEANKEFINTILSLKDNDLAPGDLITYTHWGRNVDGDIKLLDYGFTHDVRKNLYWG